MDKLRLIYASAISSSVAALFVTIITIAAELNPPIKDWLKALSGHHWTSKSIFSVLLYLVVLVFIYLIFRRVNAKKIHYALWGAITLTVVGSLALFIFFTGHHLGWY